MMWLIVAIVLTMLLCERLLITRLSHTPNGIAFLRSTRLLHPNSLSLLRLPQGIISVALAHYGHWEIATLWFAFWMITDLTDGTIARNCDLQTETGKWLDPLSDKAMYFPVLAYFAFGPHLFSNLDIKFTLSPMVVGAFLLTDILGQCSRLFTQKVAANSFGKLKTALVTVLLSLISLAHVGEIAFMNQRFLNVIMFAAAILAFLSFYCKVIPDIWYANSFTFANFLCGILAIWQALQDHFILSFILVFFGQFFDLFDGRMARKYGSTKRGAVFDDVADATSFGLAVGCIIFRCLAYQEAWIPIWLSAIITLFYLGCLVYRLYRFIHPTRQMPRGVFQGLPSPAGAMLAGSAVLLSQDFAHDASGAVAAAIVLLASLLMISNIPYRHFGQSLWPSMPRPMKLLLFILLILFISITLGHRKNKSYESTFKWFCFATISAYLVAAIDRPDRHHSKDETDSAA